MDFAKAMLVITVPALILAFIVSLAGPLLGTLIGGAIGVGLAFLAINHDFISESSKK